MHLSNCANPTAKVAIAKTDYSRDTAYRDSMTEMEDVADEMLQLESDALTTCSEPFAAATAAVVIAIFF